MADRLLIPDPRVHTAPAFSISARKAAIRDLADQIAPQRDSWIKRNRFYYEGDYRYMRFLVPAGLRVLELGCGTGRLLAELNPSFGVGVDFSPKMIEIARAKATRQGSATSVRSSCVRLSYTQSRTRRE